MDRRLRRLLPLPLLALAGLLLLGSAPGPQETEDRAARLGWMEVVILGAVEGITEFLPVSSTGHLILANRALGLDSAEPIPGTEWTLKEAVDAYSVIIQAGAIAAVLLLYRARALQMLAGLAGRDRAGRGLLVNLVIAVLPAVVLGLTLDDWIESVLFGPGPVAAALAVGAVVMIVADRRGRRLAAEDDAAGDPLASLTPRQALGIGLAQCAALWPGMSRSMSAMVGGYFAGLPPRAAAEFSFLLGLPTLGGACLLKLVKSGPAVLAVFGWAHALLGALVAAVTAALAVRLFVASLTRLGLTPFAIYRLVLAAAVAGLLVMQ